MSGTGWRRAALALSVAISLSCGGGDSTGPSNGGGLTGTWIVAFGDLTAPGITCAHPTMRLTLQESSGAVIGSFVADGEGICGIGTVLYAGTMGAGQLQAGALANGTLTLDLKASLGMDGVVRGDSAAGTMSWNVLFPGNPNGVTLQASWSARRLPATSADGTAWRLAFDSTAALVAQTQTTAFPLSAYDRGGSHVGLPTLTWSTSAPARATVSNAGLVTATTTTGIFRVRAQAGKAWAEAVGYVVQLPATVEATPASLTFTTSGSKGLAVVVKDAAGAPIAGLVPDFQTDNATVVTVSGGGVVTTAGADGTATITISAAGVATTVGVTVARVPASVVADSARLVLAPNSGSLQLTATVRDSSDAILPGAVTWTTTNAGVATVTSGGLVSPGTTPGTGSVIATSGGRADTVQVQLLGQPFPSIIATTPILGRVSGLAVTASGAFYAGGVDASGLFRGDLPAVAVGTPLPMGGIILAVGFDPTGTRAYAGEIRGGQLGVFDVATNTLVDSLPLGDARAIVVSPDGTELWVGTSTGLFVYNLPALTLKAQPLALVHVRHLRLHPTLPRVYATLTGGVQELSLTTKAVLRTFTMTNPGNAVQQTDVLPDGSALLVATEGGGVRSVDLTSGLVTKSTPPYDAFGVRYLPAAGVILVSTTSGQVRVLDPVTLATLTSLPITGPGRRIEVTPDGTMALVADELGGVRFVQ